MKKIYAGLLLILMMLGHNYVINQPQSLQQQIQQIHKVNVTEFNLLYSIPSILALLSIIPVGIFYHSCPNFTLLFGITVLFLGQLLVSMFGSQGKQFYFSTLVAGRTLQASGAQVLYMIQGNLASSWMGNLAGLVFILPEVGQIMNAFFTPFAAIHWGMKTSLWLGVIFCFISSIACWFLYCHLKTLEKYKKSKETKLEMIEGITSKQNAFDSQFNKYQFHQNQLIVSYQQTGKQEKLQESKGSANLISKQSGKQTKQKMSYQSFKKQTDEKNPNLSQPDSIFKAGKVFWLTILICAINQCLYFPFLDNANQMIQLRFKIPYSQTGYFLCLPFCAAIITTILMSRVLSYFERKSLILYSSVIPFLGHLIIMVLPNCEEQTLPLDQKLLLAFGFFVFGSGIGCYYSVSFPAVGMAVPEGIRGLSYGVLCFFQTLAMSMVPLLSAIIIEEDITNQIQGYKNSSFMFVVLTLIGIFVAYLIKFFGKQNSYSYDDQQQLIEQEDLNQISNLKQTKSLKIQHG